MPVKGKQGKTEDVGRAAGLWSRLQGALNLGWSFRIVPSWDEGLDFHMSIHMSNGQCQRQWQAGP